MVASVLAIVLAGIGYLHPFAGGASQPGATAGPSNLHLAAVDFVGPTTGWVAATLDSGSFAVLFTSDAGSTWTRQLAGRTDQRTFYLRFFDSRRGVLGLMGPRPAMYRTTDGGQTWSQRPMSPAEYLLSMSFVDPDHGWLLLHTGALLRTADGGDHWTHLNAPVAAGDEAYRVQFSDRDVGWLVTASVKPVAYKSVDGGVSWYQLPLPTPVGGWPGDGEFFVAAQPTHGAGVVATVVNLPPFVGRSGVGERVVAYPPLTVRAFDGGLPVWYSYAIFADATPGGDLRAQTTVEANRWPTETQAPNQVQLGSLDGGATWADGGATWSATRNIAVLKPLGGSLQVLDSRHAWYGAMAGGTRAMLEMTADAGQTWEMIGLPET
jgi:photosystem II stability/assembly factor-like uncharacterized protein